MKVSTNPVMNNLRKSIYEKEIEDYLDKKFSSTDDYEQFRANYKLWRKDPANQKLILWKIQYSDIVQMFVEYWAWRQQVDSQKA